MKACISKTLPRLLWGWLFSLFLFATAAWCKNIVLFDDAGKQVAEYSQLITTLSTNDVLVFQGQPKFTVVKFLGSGSTTRVFSVTAVGESDLTKTFALRLPLNDKMAGVYPMPKFIDFFYFGVEAIHRAQLGPGLIDFAPSQYIAVEEIRPHAPFTQLLDFGSFLARYDKIPKEIRESAETALPDLAKKLSVFLEIGDLKPDQLVFDGQRWWLLDFSGAKFLEGTVVSNEVSPDYLLGKIHSMHIHDFEAQLRELMDLSKNYSGLNVLEHFRNDIYGARVKMIASGKNPVTGVILTLESNASIEDSDQALRLSYNEERKMAAFEKKLKSDVAWARENPNGTPKTYWQQFCTQVTRLLFIK